MLTNKRFRLNSSSVETQLEIKWDSDVLSFVCDICTRFSFAKYYAFSYIKRGLFDFSHIDIFNNLQIPTNS